MNTFRQLNIQQIFHLAVSTFQHQQQQSQFIQHNDMLQSIYDKF
jgi:hypothetical protein